MYPSRPTMYVDDCYPRSMPSTPYERSYDSSPMDFSSPFAQDSLRTDSGFCALPVGVPPPPPGFMSSGGRISPPYSSSYMVDSYSGSSSKCSRDEIVRKYAIVKVSVIRAHLFPRTNLYVQLANSQISHTSRYAQVQPKMCRDGRFPSDFRTARTVEEMKVMDREYPRLPSVLQNSKIISIDTRSHPHSIPTPN